MKTAQMKGNLAMFIKGEIRSGGQQFIGRVFLLSILYFIFGKLALLLAIPPGYATAVWPAAGVALVFTMIYGPAVAIGASIGSFLINFTVPDSSFINLTYMQVLPPLMISLGAAGHAVIGSKLVERFTTYPNAVEAPKDIVKFLFFGGILSCLISSMWGVFTLYIFDLIPLNNLLINWFTWWVGDTIGVLLMAPLLLMFIKKHRAFTWVAIPSMAIMTATIMLFFFVSSVEQNKLDRNFNSTVTKISDSVQNSFVTYVGVLNYIRLFFENSTEVTRDDFSNFTKSILKDVKGIQALEWIPVVSGESKEKFENKVRASGYKDYQIVERNELGDVVPATYRHVYYPVEYVEPIENNRKAFGYDLGSNLERLKTILFAFESKKITSTNPVSLLQLKSNGTGLIMFNPVFDDKSKRKGLVAGVFDIRDIVSTNLKEADFADLQFYLYENSHENPENRKLIYANNSDSNETAQESWDSAKDNLKGESSFDLANKKWTIRVVKSAQTVLANKSWSTWFFLAGGLMFTVLIQIVLLTTTGRENQIARVVKEKTRELIRANEEIGRMSKVKSQFFANMSHEIRTPLNGIIGMTELMINSKNLDYENMRFANIIKDCSHGLLTIINDILDFSKISSGKLKLERRSFSLEAMIDGVLSLFEGQAKMRNVQISYYINKDVPSFIITDEIRLRQILTNLVGNAVKFTSEGEVKIEVSAKKIDAKDIELNFHVRDSGIGISKNVLSNIFDSFTQADASTTRRFGGTGLGLSISKNLVELLGGKIGVESQIGQGSHFYFSIIAHEGESSSKIVEDAVVELSTTFSSKYPLRILVVEDNPINQKLALIILEKFGYKVDLANNGQESIEAAAYKDFDLILMDMQMPIVDGVEATKIIRSRFPEKNMQIYAMTANAFPEDKQKCFDAGMDGFVAKPITIKEIQSILISVYEKKVPNA